MNLTNKIKSNISNIKISFHLNLRKQQLYVEFFRILSENTQLLTHLLIKEIHSFIGITIGFYMLID